MWRKLLQYHLIGYLRKKTNWKISGHLKQETEQKRIKSVLIKWQKIEKRESFFRQTSRHARNLLQGQFLGALSYLNKQHKSHDGYSRTQLGMFPQLCSSFCSEMKTHINPYPMYPIPISRLNTIHAGKI